jgi:hypothetical protein
MRALTPMMRRFVVAIIQQKFKNGSQAARLAGYTHESIRAFELLRHPKIVAALDEEAGRRLMGLSMPAVIMEKSVEVDDRRPQRTHLELMSIVADKLKALGMRAPELLPAPIDAEYKSVSKQEGKSDAVAQTDAVARDEDERQGD